MERKLTTTRLADGKFEKKGEEEREEEKSGYREKGSVWRRKTVKD